MKKYVLYYAGKYWGKTWEDGRETNYGWTTFENAEVKTLHNLSLKPYKNNFHHWGHNTKELNKGRVREIELNVIFKD